MTDNLPQRLREAFVKAGFVDPRNGEPSMRRIAEEVGVSNATASRYFRQQSKSELETRQKFADALGLNLSQLDKLVDGAEVDPYTPPSAAHGLSYENRRLIDQLINALGKSEAAGGMQQEEVVDRIDRENVERREADELDQRRRRTRAISADVQAALEDERTAALDQPPGEIPGEDR